MKLETYCILFSPELSPLPLIKSGLTCFTQFMPVILSWGGGVDFAPTRHLEKTGIISGCHSLVSLLPAAGGQEPGMLGLACSAQDSPR